MILDFVPKTDYFTLTTGPADNLSEKDLMTEYGMDIGKGGIAYCRSPYTAAPFYKHATPEAIAELVQIVKAYEDSSKIESGAHIRCPADQELRGFQKADIEYLLARGGGLDADEPGLGKTPTAICFANELSAKRVLVICPAAVRHQWAARIREWSTMPYPINIYLVMGSRSGVREDVEWTIVSYDLARTEGIGKALASGTYDLIILDEAHMLKTSESSRTRAIFGDYATGTYRRRDNHEYLFDSLRSRAGAILALTGTPLLNRPREAYTLARAMCWDSIDWLSEQAFQNRFNPVVRKNGVRKDGTSYSFTEEHVGRFAELQFRLRGHFMTRHLKRAVLPQLKLPVYDIVNVVETGAVKEALYAESLLGIDPDTFDGKDIKILGHIAQVRHMMGLAIAPQVADFVDMLIDGGETKLVVFAWHKDVLDFYQIRFDRYGVVRIDGSTSHDDREIRKTMFIHGNAQIIIGNMQAMGVGTDGLQLVANHALLAEPDWVPSNNVQAIDRLDRYGQARTVTADIFVAPGSVLEKILASALKKAHNIHKSLDRSI